MSNDETLISKGYLDLKEDHSIIHTYSQNIKDLLMKTFPNHENPDIKVVKRYNENNIPETLCKLCIGGELLTCSGNFDSEEEAKEYMSILAIEFLEELFDRKQELLNTYSGSSFKHLINSIFDNMFQVKEEAFELKTEPEIKVKLVESLNEPLIKNFDTEFISKEASISSSEISFVSSLNQFLQKSHSNIKFNPTIHTQYGYYGAQMIFNNESFSTAAVYKTKVEAKEAIAKEICEKFLPHIFNKLPENEKSTPNSNYVKWFHEYCQKKNFPPPSYSKIQQENQLWVSQITFNNKLFTSAKFINLALTRSDLCKQIYDYLLEIGDISNQYMTFSQNLSPINSQTPQPVIYGYSQPTYGSNLHKYPISQYQPSFAQYNSCTSNYPSGYPYTQSFSPYNSQPYLFHNTQYHYNGSKDSNIQYTNVPPPFNLQFSQPQNTQTPESQNTHDNQVNNQIMQQYLLSLNLKKP